MARPDVTPANLTIRQRRRAGRTVYIVGLDDNYRDLCQAATERRAATYIYLFRLWEAGALDRRRPWGYRRLFAEAVAWPWRAADANGRRTPVRE